MAANKEEKDIFEGLSKEEVEVCKQRMENYPKYFDLYHSDPRFKEYVDKNCKTYKVRVDFCLLMKTVQEVGDYYMSVDKNPQQTCIPAEVIFEEDKAC